MCKKKYPKVLIISHNSFNLNLSIGKTFTSLFQDWPRESIAQLYFHNEIPDTSICKNFFRITEEQLLFNNKQEIGEIINEKQLLKSQNLDFKMHDFKIRHYVKKLEFFNLLRNIIWKGNRWDNVKLNQWLEEFSPDIIFFAGGGSAFAYDLVFKISQKFSLPILLYFMDDFILPRKTIDIFWWINWLHLHKSLKNILPQVKQIFTIGEDMSNEYKNRFEKDCIEIMNSVNIDDFEVVDMDKDVQANKNDIVKMAYFGGLHLNRWKTLIKLAVSLKEFFDNEKKIISLHIYTNFIPTKKILEKIHQPPYLIYEGSVSKDIIIQEMKKYDVLVHLESFDRQYIEKTKLSISTKIPEYLAAGKPILGVGPSSISSIKYLKNIGNNYIIDNFNNSEDVEVLNKIYNNFIHFKIIGKKNIEIARDNHSAHKNREILRKVIERFSK